MWRRGLLLGVLSNALYLLASSQNEPIQITVQGSDTSIVQEIPGQVDSWNTRRFFKESVFRDGSGFENNRSLSLENIGTGDIKNPIVEIEGKRFIYSKDDLLHHVDLSNLNCFDDTVKTVFSFLAENYYHWFVSTTGPSVQQQIRPLLAYNAFGAGECENANELFAAALQSLGYKTKWMTYSDIHSVGMVLAPDGRVIPLDVDVGAFYTERNSHLLASVGALYEDQDLVRRVQNGMFPVAEGTFEFNDLSYMYSPHVAKSESRDVPEMDETDLIIRPYEKITFHYAQPVGEHQHFFHIYWTGLRPEPAPPPTSSLGIQEYRPRFKADWLTSIAFAENVRIAIAGESSVLSSLDSSKSSSVIISMPNPYAITGGAAFLSSNWKHDSASLRLSWIHPNGEELQTWRLLPPSTLGARIDTFDFRDAIGAIGHPIINSYDVKIEWIGCTPDAVTIDSLLLRTIFQLNPNVLPALRVGTNTIHIASEDGRPLDGLLYIHEYKALSGYDFPGVVTSPIFPLTVLVSKAQSLSLNGSRPPDSTSSG